MIKENQFKVQPTIPKTETRIMLNNWRQPVKQSNLSVAARKKIINYSGSNYVSPRMMTDISEPAIYGPGKRNFRDFCRRIKDGLGVNAVTGRISHDSDIYAPGNNYAGAIIYAVDGEFVWMNSGGDTAGRRGRSFYVIIKNTNIWPPEAFNHPGGVHGYLIHKALGFNMGNQDDRYKLCAGGFAWMPNREPSLRFNSGTLNSINQNGCESDGSLMLSPDEKDIVRYCWNEYTSRGVGHNFEIPSYLFE
ncbi:hypothetical protein [endosymbiont GvMRE of Glomus versiforme]|uniref:hypothetical protein n=1 Tax=endosymbiont GvMRE of Glomus versiforme TaxID=2039283 RepID=UPI000EEB3074|nr:hypothetical protein [endosymbiont GvMRE of Glomus versiforme]RHZ35953.1 hypothetical protein GvMRE_Ic4g132 [endosymbiont GvMRE of Glomus versiforme]